MGTTSMEFGLREDGANPAANLILEDIARATLAVSEELCDRLQDIIDRDLTENHYQRFLRDHPALLDPLASSIVELQQLGEVWKTDFVIRRLDDEYVFVEIEKPRDKPLSDYPHPTATLSHALGQVLNWFVWVEDNIAYAQSHGFPGIHSPLGVVVIGRNRDLSGKQLRVLRMLNDMLHPRISIFTYDDILLNARNILRNLTTRSVK